MCSIVVSIFLHACESWTLIAELEKRTQSFEMRRYRKLLNISYKDHIADQEDCRQPKQPLENMVNFRARSRNGNLYGFGHVSSFSSLEKTIVTGYSERKKTKKQTED